MSSGELSTSSCVRSMNCELMSLVTFISRTKRQIAVYWLDYNGRRVRYCVLNYADQFPLTTYETHPWIFRDNLTGDKLVTSSGQEVFWPQPWDGGNQDRVIIGIPVYTLREKCLQEVRKLQLSPDEINDLLIPKTIKEDLIRGTDNAPFSVHVEIWHDEKIVSNLT